MQKSKVSAIVCAKNEERFIGACLERLRKQTHPCEIIVVDGHSTDRTAKIARRYAKVVFDNGKGIADARNIGWRTARGDVIAYCDADCRPHSTWIEEIVAAMPGHVGTTGPLVPYDCDGYISFNLRLWTDWLFGLFAKLGHPCVPGPNMAFRKAALEREPFRAPLMEDYEIGLRIRRLGRLAFNHKMNMSISGRRYVSGFYRTAARYYIPNLFRLESRLPLIHAGYWKH